MKYFPLVVALAVVAYLMTPALCQAGNCHTGGGGGAIVNSFAVPQLVPVYGGVQPLNVHPYGTAAFGFAPAGFAHANVQRQFNSHAFARPVQQKNVFIQQSRPARVNVRQRTVTRTSTRF